MTKETRPPSPEPAATKLDNPALKVDPKEVARIAWAAFAGTMLEWYDYFLFGTAAALVFDYLFFTEMNDTAAVLAAFGTFGVGFAARPIGAFVFGMLGDRWGRRPTLILSIVLIGAATGVIGMLPTYQNIGLAAPVLLVVLRLFQGLAVGGEWGGATTIAIEHAPPEKRARYASMVQLGSPAGTLLSSGAFALVLLLPGDVVDVWGWRLPFLAAFPLLAIALWIRLKVEESPVYEQLAQLDDRPKAPALQVFTKSFGRLVVAIAAALLGVGGFYLLNTYVISYTTTMLDVERQSVVNATLIAAVVQMIVVVICGRIAERLGPGRVTFIGGILTALAAWPLFMMIDTGSVWAITVAISAGIGLLTITYSVTGALLAELFPVEQRYSGVSLGYNLAGALTGFLPFIATWMTGLQSTPTVMPAVVLLVVVSLLTALGGLIGEKLRVTDKVILTET